VLGFGRAQSTSTSSSEASNVTSAEKEKMQERKVLDKKVDEMDGAQVEEFLKTKSSAA
jgi:hypothetical protein